VHIYIDALRAAKIAAREHYCADDGYYDYQRATTTPMPAPLPTPSAISCPFQLCGGNA
jgi:hypothetical protein